MGCKCMTHVIDVYRILRRPTNGRAVRQSGITQMTLFSTHHCGNLAQINCNGLTLHRNAVSKTASPICLLWQKRNISLQGTLTHSCLYGFPFRLPKICAQASQHSSLVPLYVAHTGNIDVLSVTNAIYDHPSVSAAPIRERTEKIAPCNSASDRQSCPSRPTCSPTTSNGSAGALEAVAGGNSPRTMN